MADAKKAAKPDLKLGSLHKPAASSTKQEVSDAVAGGFAAGAAVKKEKKLLDWQKDKRAVTAWLPKDQYKALNELHVDDERSVRVLIEDAVDLYLLVRGKLPVNAERARALLEETQRKG